jgi:MFS transporter, AAHS family, 4-hydroxybenzoate transporter
MAQARTVNVSRLVDGQKIGALHVWLIVWSFLVLLSDGYDIGAIAYAAPALAKLWHVTNRAAFGPVFSSLFIGMLIGAPLLGYLGDRFGRKKAIITGAIWYGLCVLAQTQAGSLDQLLWLRLLSGIGIGGILPNTIALNAEFAPARFRATMIIIMFTGITFGGGVPGPIAAWLVPHYGWQVLFFIGGIVPIVVGICLIWALPESLKFLAVRKTNHDEAVRVARMLAPQENFGSDTAFVTDAAEERGSTSPLELFKHGLGVVTPLLWILFMINLMVFYFMNSWIPLVFSDAGLNPNATALAVTVFQWGGTLGGYAIARPVDKWAFGPIIVFFAIGAIAVAAVGYLEHNQVALLIAVGVSGFCTLGLQFAINAMSGLIYPTQFRSMGVGWAFGAGRIGSFLGPMIGATLIATHLPFRQLFVYAAAPLLIGLVVSLLIIPAYNKARSGESLEPSLQGT